MTKKIDYQKPPLIETALSVQFRNVPALTNALLGCFWMTQSESYPNTEDAPPLDPQQELFGGHQLMVPRIPRLRIGNAAPSRIKMTTPTRDRMIQVQNGRLVVNWLKASTVEYPRFASNREEFRRVFSELVAFLSSRSLDSPAWDQWEVTYVNRIPKGEAWSNRDEWPLLFPGLLGSPNINLIGPLESAGCDWHFEISPRLGRLHVELTHGWEGPSFQDREGLLLQLTARGPLVTGANLDDILCGIDVGHNAIVTTFDAIVGDQMRKLWEKQ